MNRAWICFALTEKTLERYLRALVGQRNRGNLNDWYESGALLRWREDCDMFLGILTALSVVVCLSVCLYVCMCVGVCVCGCVDVIQQDFGLCVKDIPFDSMDVLLRQERERNNQKQAYTFNNHNRPIIERGRGQSSPSSPLSPQRHTQPHTPPSPPSSPSSPSSYTSEKREIAALKKQLFAERRAAKQKLTLAEEDR